MPDLKLSNYMENFKHCLQFEKPYCQAACPFHIDINDLIARIKQGSYNSAYTLYRNAVGFPVIVSHICSQPCQDVCPMKDHGGAIELRKLEEAAVKYAKRREPTSYNIPVRQGKVAIIGSGPAGLGALLRMATKKYEIHLFESNNYIGGSLKNEPNADIFMEDVELQLRREKYEIHLNSDISTRKEINDMGFDVVFVATGKSGNDFGIGQNHVMLDDKTAWFAGGALVGDEDIYALAGGLHMGIVLESYLKTGNLNYDRNILATNVIIDPKKIKDLSPVSPSDTVYMKEEALSEAERCLQCQCDFCRTYEDLTAFYDKWPLRIKDEIFATTLEGTSEVKATPAKRLLSTSNLTGITKAVCPKDIDLDNLILAGRQKMHRLDKAPWAFHDYWLRDMDFSNSNNALVMLNSPISDDTKYIFFPGCQLGAGLPELIVNVYDKLLSNNESMGLMIRCCGAPALWSGDEDRHESTINEMRTQWKDMGSPVLLIACPTCISQINKYLPEIKTISIYEYMDENNVEPNFFDKYQSEYSPDEPASMPDQEPMAEPNSISGQSIDSHTFSSTDKYSIFDPCSTREDALIKKAVRNLTAKMGIQNIELPRQSNVPGCCSYGGQPEIANPDYAAYVTDKRKSESEYPYITYCINCRDSFLKADKKAVHLLELMFSDTSTDVSTAVAAASSGSAAVTHLTTAAVPTASERRDNRIFLKKLIYKKYLGEDMKDTRKKYDFKLIMSDEIKHEMDSQKILEEEVYDVVDFVIRTNRKVVDPQTGIHSGYRQIGYMTFWVSYKETEEENIFEIVDVYEHRMEIELEAVWNGVKTDIDM